MKTTKLIFFSWMIFFLLEVEAVIAGNEILPINAFAIPGPGDIVINQFSPSYGGASDEYIELLNKTGAGVRSFIAEDLPTSRPPGNTGSAGGNLTGTLGPYQFLALVAECSRNCGPKQRPSP